ncbi:MAG: DUF2924 domain-containing protein, partial [Solirubrobacteraceae bacterium]|nr:DUF2924 domain-containing protein [Solirubrobacteraceae bacterium]
KTHQVTVLEDGYSYAGQYYASLSEIAGLITGTKWNGPKFFGLRPPKTKHAQTSPIKSPTFTKVSGAV